VLRVSLWLDDADTPPGSTRFTPAGVKRGTPALAGVPRHHQRLAHENAGSCVFSSVRPSALLAGGRSANPLSTRVCRRRGERMARWFCVPASCREDAVARERLNRAGVSTVSLRRASSCSHATTRYELDANSSPASTCSTSAASTGSSSDASRTKPECNLSNSRSDIESRSTPPTRSSARGRCNHRKRISAARESVTAFSRSPRSISASEGARSYGALRAAVGELLHAIESEAGTPAQLGVPRTVEATKSRLVWSGCGLGVLPG
jgi:hypothetical protein